MQTILFFTENSAESERFNSLNLNNSRIIAVCDEKKLPYFISEFMPEYLIFKDICKKPSGIPGYTRNLNNTKVIILKDGTENSFGSMFEEQKCNVFIKKNTGEDDILKLIHIIDEMEYGDCFRCSDLSFFSDKDRIGTAGHRFLKQEIISLYSAQGGAGRTTIALNLAWLLAESLKDLKILFLDLNFSEGYPDSAVRLSQEPLENSGILIDNITDLNSAFYRSITRIDGCGIDFIFPPPALNRSEGLSVDLLDEMVMRARKDYGIVIADIPNRFDNIFIEMLDLSTTILLVATPETSQVMRVNKLLKIMPADAAKMLVLNNRDNLKVSPGKVRMISSLSEMPFAGYMQYVMQAGRHGYLKIGRKNTEIISLRGQIEKLLDNLFADKHIM